MMIKVITEITNNYIPNTSSAVVEEPASADNASQIIFASLLKSISYNIMMMLHTHVKCEN